jgi:hypothetical protein
MKATRRFEERLEVVVALRGMAQEMPAKTRGVQSMQTCKFIQTGIIVAGLAAGFSQHVSGATEQRADQDEGGRPVTLKPISQSRLGGDGGNEWLLGGALAGIVLLGLGGLVTGKLIK